MASDKANAVVSTRFFGRARWYFSFRIEMIQTDNGPEFGKWFADHLKRRGVSHRHNHPRSPNENGHLERFNRTLQEEMPKEGFSMHDQETFRSSSTGTTRSGRIWASTAKRPLKCSKRFQAIELYTAHVMVQYLESPQGIWHTPQTPSSPRSDDVLANC